MSNSQEIVVVAGATGNLGRLVCEMLVKRSKQEGRSILVRGLVRKRAPSAASAGAAKLSESGIVIEPVDYASNADLQRAVSGASAVVSTLQGSEDVIVGVQSRLLEAAIAEKVQRFIPSDFAVDFTKLPPGTNRNFDTRLAFHEAADDIIRRSQSRIELTSIYQGGFAELLSSGWMLVNYKKRQVQYFGAPDTSVDFTTWSDTAEFTAAVALDRNPTPRALTIAGERLSPRELREVARRATGVEFTLKRLMSIRMLRGLITVMRFLMPGKKGNLMPMWVGLQYALALALGSGSAGRLDNDRYPDIQWTPVDGIIRDAFERQTVG